MLVFLQNHYNWKFQFDITQGKVTPYFAVLYHPTHARFSLFLIGAALAYAIVRYDHFDDTPPQGSSNGFSLVIKYAALLVAFLFIALPGLPPSPEDPPLGVQMFLTAAWHTLPALSSAYILYTALVPPTHKFSISWLRKLLSLQLWYPLGLLSYGIFLLHFRIVHFLWLSVVRPTPQSLTHAMVLQVFAAAILISILFALPLYVLVEAPVQRFFGTKKAKQQ